MSISGVTTANEILNRVAAETGLTPLSDPWSSTQQHFQQMRYLLQSCGEELMLSFPWEWSQKPHQIITSDGDSGDYPLPDDFLQMLDQTGWERANNVPLYGPLTAQDWTYMLGRDLVSSTIYASFRLKEGQIAIFPQPPPAGLDINLEYQSRYWCRDNKSVPTYRDAVAQGSDTVLFDRTLITRMLKMRWLESKGFDTTAALAAFETVYNMLTGKDKGAQIVSAGRNRRHYPYLTAYGSTPDTGFGVP